MQQSFHLLLILVGLKELEAELKKDINKVAISTMCVRNEKDDIQLVCFLSAGSLLKFAGEFEVVSGQKYGSEIFTEIWRRNLQQAKSISLKNKIYKA